MTIQSEVSRVAYVGSGTPGPFAVPFYFADNADLKVVKTTVADGTESTMVLTTDYSLTGAGDPGGGTLTLTAALSSSYRITVIRDPAILQLADYTPYDKFPAETHERALDKLTTISQRLRDLFDRTLRLTDGDIIGVATEVPPVPQRANKYLVFDAAGVPSVSPGTGTDNTLRTELADVVTAGKAGSLIGFKQIGAGAINRTLKAKGLEHPVTPQDYGAAADGVTDDTGAINAALASGRDVWFPPATYLTAGGHVQSTIGQRVFGSGHMFPALGGTGVRIKKSAGGAVLWALNGHNGGLRDVMLDGNGLAGNVLQVNTKYLHLQNLTLTGQGGTDFAMRLNSVNSCLFENIHFPDGNYGNIQTNGASALLYSTFVNVTMGTVTGPYAVDLANALSDTFDGLFLENPIRIGATCENLDFNGFSSETAITNTKLIEITSASAVNISFNGVRVACSGNRTVSLVDIANAQGVYFKDVHIQDLVSVTPILFALDGVRNFSIRDATVYMGNGFDFIKCDPAGPTNLNVVLDNVNEINSAMGGICRWLTQGLEVRNTNFAHVFEAGTFKRVTMANVANPAGEVNTANIDAAALVSLTACDKVVDAGGLAVMTDCVLANGQRVLNGRAKTTNLAIPAAATAVWAGAVPAQAIVKGVLCRNTAAVTGGGGFTGYSVGHNWTIPGADVDAWGANVSPGNGSVTQPDNFTIEPPLTNRNNVAGDIVLTAVGANFTGGTVRITVFYELMGNANS